MDIILEAVIFLDVGVTLSKQLVALIMPSLFRNLVAAIQVIFEIFVCGFISSDFIGVFFLECAALFRVKALVFLVNCPVLLENIDLCQMLIQSRDAALFAFDGVGEFVLRVIKLLNLSGKLR